LGNFQQEISNLRKKIVQGNPSVPSGTEENLSRLQERVDAAETDSNSRLGEFTSKLDRLQQKVAAINLGIDTSVGRTLRDLDAYQAKDPKLLKIMEAVKQLQTPPDGRYLVRHGVLYSKDSMNYPYWRPLLATELENKVISFVHVSGHLGTEKCMAKIANTFHVKSLGRKVRRSRPKRRKGRVKGRTRWPF
jgi:hypothetical protein